MTLPLSGSTEIDPLLQRRREIAQRIDRVLGQHPDVTAVYVLGSVASGRVDERSDVDLGVVCRSHTLSESDRKELLSPIGSDWQFGRPSSQDPVWAGNAMPSQVDEGLMDGIPVDIMYQSAADISEVIDEVVSRGALATQRIPIRPYTLIGMLRQAWVIRDTHGILRGWLEQTSAYPKLLKQNVLRHFAPILKENAGALTESAERHHGAATVLFFLVRAADALTSILYAVNDVYDPADKRAETTILPMLANVPGDFMSRFDDILQGPFDDNGALERARAFEDLATEALRLADAQIRS